MRKQIRSAVFHGAQEGLVILGEQIAVGLIVFFNPVAALNVRGRSAGGPISDDCDVTRLR
jgi:hypothetical protein